MLQRKKRERKLWASVSLENPKQSMSKWIQWFWVIICHPKLGWLQECKFCIIFKEVISVAHHINKEINHMVILINAEKSFVQLNTYSWLREPFANQEWKGTSLTWSNKKPVANTPNSCEISKFCPEMGPSQGWLPSIISAWHCTAEPGQNRRFKGIRFEKPEMKLICRWYVCI